MPRAFRSRASCASTATSRITFSDTDRRIRQTALLNLYALQKSLAAARAAGATAAGQLDTPGAGGVTSSRADTASRLTRVQADLVAQFNAVNSLSRAIEGYSGLPTADQRRQLDWAFEDAARAIAAMNAVLQTDTAPSQTDGPDQADRDAMKRFTLALSCALLAGACGSSTAPTPPPTEDPPKISCPAAQTIQLTSGNAIAVTFPGPTFVNGKPPVTTSCTPVSGSTFNVGTTTVSCTATDALQRADVCSFAITVLAVPPPPKLAVTRFFAFGDSITRGEDGNTALTASDVEILSTRDSAGRADLSGLADAESGRAIHHAIADRHQSGTAERSGLGPRNAGPVPNVHLERAI